jgi:LmbE family N-acetylglucosaminyl deacetylase
LLEVGLGSSGRRVDRILCLGAHCDDIEIGCGATMLKLAEGPAPPAVTWVVLSADAGREREARESARIVLDRVTTKEVVIKRFRDSFFPYQGGQVKEYFEELKEQVAPDLVFTHHRGDLHQDHRLVAELTWNTFRDHLILEYEVPKYDGDLGAPNVFVHVEEALARRKVEHLLTCFKSQLVKSWFAEDVFRALLRLRGMESNAPAGYAEAFYCRKLLVTWD